MLLRPRIAAIMAIVFALAALTGCGSGSGDPSASEKLQASVNANWANYRDRHGLPAGGLSIYVESPSGNYFAAADMAGAHQKTHFRIASNTKTFTSSAIMLLSQQGKLRIDDKIVALIPGKGVPYVPDAPQYNIPYKSDITIRQLLSHTAGVFDVTNTNIPETVPVPYAGKNYITYIRSDQGDPDHQFSPDELVGVVAACQIKYFAPGADYRYSNTGYSLLAIIIERVSGMTYDRFIRENLIVPNGLSSTSVPMLASDQTLPSPYSDGYFFEEGVIARVTEDNMSVNIAEGNIISTPADLARWIRRLIRGEAGPDAVSVEAMKTPTPQSGSVQYGLGIHYRSGLGYGHTGAHAGYLSLMIYDPADQVTVILYFNVWDYKYMLTDQFALLWKAAQDAKKAVGY